jgi:hypothetical protein
MNRCCASCAVDQALVDLVRQQNAAALSDERRYVFQNFMIDQSSSRVRGRTQEKTLGARPPSAREHIHDLERRYFGGTMRRRRRCWHGAAGDGVRDYNF